MKTILVSGASGVVGYGILRSLKATKLPLRLIGSTIYSDSAAQGFCDIFELAPPTSDAEYIEWLLYMIRKYDVELIIPGIEADMHKWAESISILRNSRSKIMVNNIELIFLTKDKWAFYEELCRINTPMAIETSLNPNYDFLVENFGLPFLFKPRSGYGSRGIIKVDSEGVFLRHKKDIGKVLMAQPIIGSDDQEYTTAAFCDGNGGVCASITLKRKLSKDGFTEKAEVVEVDGIDEALLTLSQHFKPVGPTNFQFRLHNNLLKLLEINPRISSATSIRTAFGYNESLMAVEFFLENIKPKQPFIKRGKAVRYTEDLIFYETRPDR